MVKKIHFVTLWVLVFLIIAQWFILGVQGKEMNQSISSYVYLPLITKNYPLITVFGMDGSSHFSQISQAGVSRIRLNTALLWSEVQPNGPESYNWSNSNAQKIENEILEARNKGLSVLMIVRSTPTWAMKYPQTGKKCGPIARDKFSAFANFMKEVVGRYSRPPYEVLYYAIWNEPDSPLADTPGDWPLGCWGEPGLPYFGGIYYGELLKEIYPQVKSVNPNIQIVTGSFLMYCDPRWVGNGSCRSSDLINWGNFFEGVLIGSGGSFDIVGFNGHVSYQAGENPVWSERSNWRWGRKGGLVDGKVDYLREKMNQRLGFSKPLMLTEGGLVDGTDGDTTFEQAKADYIVHNYASIWALGLTANYWYTFVGWKGSALINPSNNQPRPAYSALSVMTGLLKDATFVKREGEADFEKYIYYFGNQEIWLLIPTGEVAGTNYSVAKPGNFVKLVDIYGNQMPDPGNEITFNRPIYVFRNR